MFGHSAERLAACATLQYHLRGRPCQLRDHLRLRRHPSEPDAQTSTWLASTIRTMVFVPNPKQPTSGHSARKLVACVNQLRNSSRDRDAWTQAAAVNTTRIKDTAQEVTVATSGHSARKLAASADVGSGQVRVILASMSVLRATSGTNQKMVWHSVICPEMFVDRPHLILFRFLVACLCLALHGRCQMTMSGFLMNPWQTFHRAAAGLL